MTMNADAIILAGGKATRLHQLGIEKPKALLELSGSPVLEWAIVRLESMCREIIVAAGEDSETINKSLSSQVKANVISDDNIGTGRALITAAKYSAAEHVIVCNADTLNDVDIGTLLSLHMRRNKGATIVLTRDPAAQNAGAFAVAGDGQVLRSLEDIQPHGRRSLNANWRGASTGLLVLPRRLLLDPRIANAISFEQEIIPHIIDSEGLFAFNNRERLCLDIGTPERLTMMHRWQNKITETLCASI